MRACFQRGVPPCKQQPSPVPRSNDLFSRFCICSTEAAFREAARLSMLRRATSVVGRSVDGLVTSSYRRLRPRMAAFGRCAGSGGGPEAPALRVSSLVRGGGEGGKPSAPPAPRNLARSPTILDSSHDIEPCYPPGRSRQRPYYAS